MRGDKVRGGNYCAIEAQSATSSSAKAQKQTHFIERNRGIFQFASVTIGSCARPGRCGRGSMRTSASPHSTSSKRSGSIRSEKCKNKPIKFNVYGQSSLVEAGKWLTRSRDLTR